MMEMKENPKLDLNTGNISVLDHTNGFQYTTTDNSDGFVIDMSSPSQKGSQRGDKKTITPNYSNSDSSSLNDTDSLVSTSSSPKGSCMPENTTAVVAGSTDTATNQQQVHHQITITTGSRFSSRRNSCKRSPPPWLLGPRKIFMLFATLSSLGTILLIYFTWCISKRNGGDQ